MSTLKALYCGTDRWEERERERERNRKGQMERTEADSSETHSYITHGCLRFFSFFFLLFFAVFCIIHFCWRRLWGQTAKKEKMKDRDKTDRQKTERRESFKQKPFGKAAKTGFGVRDDEGGSWHVMGRGWSFSGYPKALRSKGGGSAKWGLDQKSAKIVLSIKQSNRGRGQHGDYAYALSLSVSLSELLDKYDIRELEPCNAFLGE